MDRMKTQFEELDPLKINVFQQKKNERVYPFQKNAMAIALMGLSQMSTVRDISVDDLSQSFEAAYRTRKPKEDDFDKVLNWFKNQHLVLYDGGEALTITQNFHDLMDEKFGFVAFKTPLPKPGCEERND